MKYFGTSHLTLESGQTNASHTCAKLISPDQIWQERWMTWGGIDTKIAPTTNVFKSHSRLNRRRNPIDNIADSTRKMALANSYLAFAAYLSGTPPLRPMREQEINPGSIDPGSVGLSPGLARSPESKVTYTRGHEVTHTTSFSATTKHKTGAVWPDFFDKIASKAGKYSVKCVISQKSCFSLVQSLKISAKFKVTQPNSKILASFYFVF